MGPITEPGRNPEMLSEQTAGLVMPFAVDRPVVPEQTNSIEDIVDRAGRVGVTSVDGEVRVEPVEEVSAAESDPAVLRDTDSRVRTLTVEEMSLILSSMRPPGRVRRGGGGGWWYIRKYLRIPGISDKDDD